jgi:hypothetical protein
MPRSAPRLADASFGGARVAAQLRAIAQDTFGKYATLIGNMRQSRNVNKVVGLVCEKRFVL